MSQCTARPRLQPVKLETTFNPSNLHIEELWTTNVLPEDSRLPFNEEILMPPQGTIRRKREKSPSIAKEAMVLSRRWPPSHGNPDYYNDAYCFLCDSSYIPGRILAGEPTKASNLLKSFRQNCIKRFKLATNPHTLTSSQLLYFKKNRKAGLSWNYVPFSDELEEILELCHRKKGGHGSIEETLEEFETLGIWWDRAKQTVYAYVQDCSCVMRKRGTWGWRRRGRRVEDRGGRLDLLEEVYQPSNPYD